MLDIESIAIAVAIASEYKCTKVTSYTRDLLKRLSFTFFSVPKVITIVETYTHS